MDMENELLPSYQILLTLLSLLTKIESMKSTELSGTTKLLKDLSKFVNETSTCETRQVIKQKALT